MDYPYGCNSPSDSALNLKKSAIGNYVACLLHRRRVQVYGNITDVIKLMPRSTSRKP